MQNAILIALAVLLLETTQIFAQSLPPNVPPSTQPNIPPATLPNVSPSTLPNAPPPGLTSSPPPGNAFLETEIPVLLSNDRSQLNQFWARADYLLWWTKSAPLPVPIVTTGNSAVGFPTLNTAGAIGSPGTRVLLGDSNLNYDAFSGVRLSIGKWFDTEETYGAEISGFLLQNMVFNWSAGSNAAGSPPLYFPRFNPVAGFEDALPISDPLRGFSGSVTATSRLQLGGAEINGVFCMTSQPGLEVQALVGFRFLSLSESFEINNTTTDLISNTVTSLRDYFGTNNQFYGSQIGVRALYDMNQLTLGVTCQLALGATVQTVNTQGSISQVNSGVYPGGFFTQPSNIGRTTRTDFGVIPSIDLMTGYKLTNHLGIFASFNFLYLNSVVRPGDQIDHSVNLTQNVVLDPNGVGKLIGPAQPSSMFNRTDFWALGVNFGFVFSF